MSARLLGVLVVPVVVMAVVLSLLKMVHLIPTGTTTLGPFFLFMLVFVATVFVAAHLSTRACHLTTKRLIKYEREE